MYIRVTTGNYKNKEAADTALQIMQSELLPKHRAHDGAGDIYVLRTGDTSSVVVACFDSRDAATAAMGTRNESVARLLEYQVEHPRTVEGEALQHDAGSGGMGGGSRPAQSRDRGGSGDGPAGK